MLLTIQAQNLQLVEKLGLDCTGDEIKELGITLLEDSELLGKMQNISNEIKALKQYFLDTKNPIIVISVEKIETKNIYLKS